MADIPLVDRYEAYQLLDDDWTKIAVDLEIIQTEGFGATKIVDANMVVKKKGNVEQEVQEGWKGRIIPFDLIQSTILADDKQALSEKENRLSEIASEYEEILDTLSEEEKEADFVNEDSWVFAEIKKAMKSDGVEPETKEKLKSVSELNTEEKALKTAIKRDNALLEEKTKDTIEHLSDEQVLELLKDKWIKPLIDNLMQLPDSIISDLVSKLEALAKKYETTFADVENQIEETEKSLSSMIDDLEGSEFDMLGLAELKKLLGGSAKMTKITDIPAIRFKGFSDTWEQRKFSELVQIERGGSPRPIDDFITDAPNGLNWVKIGDAPTQGNYITKTAEKIRPEGLPKTREVHPGDLILSNSMSFGKPYIMGIDGCIHDGWLLIRNTYGVFDLTFLCHLLGTPQMLSQYRSLAAGSTVNNLNKELVGNIYVTIPSITEQRVLGAYLEQLDNLITLHQRELEKLKNSPKSVP